MQEPEQQAVAKAADSREHLKTLQLVWFENCETRETWEWFELWGALDIPHNIRWYRMPWCTAALLLTSMMVAKTLRENDGLQGQLGLSKARVLLS